MKTIIRMGMIAITMGAFVTGAVAQHEMHHPESEAAKPQASQPKDTQPKAQRQTPMGVGMTGITAQKQQMFETMQKMMEQMAAIENEKDPAKMKSRMALHMAMTAEHMRMMQQMHAQMMQPQIPQEGEGFAEEEWDPEPTCGPDNAPRGDRHLH